MLDLSPVSWFFKVVLGTRWWLQIFDQIWWFDQRSCDYEHWVFPQINKAHEQKKYFTLYLLLFLFHSSPVCTEHFVYVHVIFLSFLSEKFFKNDLYFLTRTEKYRSAFLINFIFMEASNSLKSCFKNVMARLVARCWWNVLFLGWKYNNLQFCKWNLPIPKFP